MTTRPPAVAPIAPRRPHSFTHHGITVTDDYAWLKDENWQEVLRDPAVLKHDIRAYLEAENVYADTVLGHTEPLQKKLVAEMRGRIKEDDSSVPAPDGPFAYFHKYNEGGQPEPGDRAGVRPAGALILAAFQLVQDVAGAFARLIALVKSTAGDDRTTVRTRLIELFELFDPADPDVIAGRRNLANALY